MKNLMEDVAKLLEVELGEEFNIENCFLFNPHKITNEGLFDYNGNNMPVTFRELLLGKFKIIKPILKKEEKEYLENVLRPYKENVKHIEKISNSFDKKFLMIKLDNDVVCLPHIQQNHPQYKGLETNKNYTLKDLKLFEGEF